MSEENEVSQQEVGRLYVKLNQETEAAGYHLNPDIPFARDLVRGLIVNERRYGYRACPICKAKKDRFDRFV